MIDISVMRMLQTKEYSTEEQIFAYKTVLGLYDLFRLDEKDDVLYYPMLASLCVRLAGCLEGEKAICIMINGEIDSHADTFRNYLARPAFDFTRNSEAWAEL